MVFSSLSFLYLFLPITVLLYFICKNRTYRNIILLIASILFYAWGEPKYVILMLLASFVAYVGGLFIHHFDRPDSLKIRKTIFIITCILLISNLFIFKYLNFTIDNIEFLIGRNINIKELVLPIGISFYTFQILSYVIDLYRHNVHVQKNYLYLTLYLAFFPQLIAGPIVRYQTIEDEILHRKESLKDIIEGTRRFIIGLSKKFCWPIPLPIFLSLFTRVIRQFTVAYFTGLPLLAMHCRFILIFLVTVIWQLDWEKFLASIFLKTLIIHTPLCPLRNFGEDGIFHFPLGFETIFISPWEAIALEKHGIFSIF